MFWNENISDVVMTRRLISMEIRIKFLNSNTVDSRHISLLRKLNLIQLFIFLCFIHLARENTFWKYFEMHFKFYNKFIIENWRKTYMKMNWKLTCFGIRIKILNCLGFELLRNVKISRILWTGWRFMTWLIQQLL